MEFQEISIVFYFITAIVLWYLTTKKGLPFPSRNLVLSFFLFTLAKTFLILDLQTYHKKFLFDLTILFASFSLFINIKSSLRHFSYLLGFCLTSFTIGDFLLNSNYQKTIQYIINLYLLFSLIYYSKISLKSENYQQPLLIAIKGSFVLIGLFLIDIPTYLNISIVSKYLYILEIIFLFIFNLLLIISVWLSEHKKLIEAIGERDLLQKTIKDVNVRLLIMYNQLPAIIYSLDFNPDAKLTYISHKAEEITGYKLSSFYENLDFFKSIILDEDKNNLQKIYDGHSPVTLRLKHSNGSIIWTEHYVNLSDDILGVQSRIDVVALDITKSKKAEFSLIKEQNLNSTVFDNTASLIILTDQFGLIQNLNSATVSKFGVNKISAINQYIYDFMLVPEDRKALQEVLEDIGEFRNIADSLVLRCMGKNGSIIYLDWRLGFINDTNGIPVQIIWIGIDQTSKRKAELELSELNRSLEKKVVERTLELQTKNSELNSALFALRETQEKLIQSEKLASLGQLIAGLSHEINNPIGVIRASIDTIASEWNEDIRSKQRITIPESILNLTNSFADIQNITTGMRNRQIRSFLTAELKNHSIQNAESIADILADSGIIDIKNTDFEKIKESLLNEETILMFKKLLVVDRSLKHIVYATKRLAKITYTLKNFSGLQSNLSLVEYSLEDTIESALKLYKDYFQHGIELIKDYLYNDKIRCNPTDLTQAWSQLIWNSIQAMGVSGKLEIQTKSVGQEIIVIIRDSGIGITEEHQQKIFLPFFTTKDSGDGIGLGLYLVEQITNRHNAAINFVSKQGETIFQISFPMI
ncbi:ATP-binding protein [Leptospira sp. 96542]|nr:ATP-binding protein [Leptospira sp. 96542]